MKGKITLGLFMVIALFAMGSPRTEAGKAITFWTTEVEKDRMVVQKGIAKDFARKKGIQVQVVPVQENLLGQRILTIHGRILGEYVKDEKNEACLTRINGDHIFIHQEYANRLCLI